MFIVAEAGVFWICKQWHICIHHQVDAGCKSRNPMDWCRCSGEGSFQLVREVSVRADMVNNRFRLGAESSNL
jgi:hypothetical protein